MKNPGKIQALVALALLGAGLVLAGCKSAPPLAKDQAAAMIQAKYNSEAAAPITIFVNNAGMEEGVTAKYWTGLKRYPNGYWADFKLTPDGAKVLTLAGGGDTIQWRPSAPTDPRYGITINTVAKNHFEADDLGDIQNISDNTKTVDYDEDVVWTGVPDPLQNIGHNPGNQLSTRRTATFTLQNGAWKLESIN